MRGVYKHLHLGSGEFYHTRFFRERLSLTNKAVIQFGGITLMRNTGRVCS